MFELTDIDPSFKSKSMYLKIPFPFNVPLITIILSSVPAALIVPLLSI